jgi:hypothetical protein
VPDAVIGLAAASGGERAPAKGWREAGLRERRLARAAVGDDRYDTVLAEFLYELFDLRVPAEEAVGFLLAH